MIARLLIFVASAVISGVFLLQFCSMIFECGCRAWWSGSASHCNIHMPGPHCPWCMYGRSGYYVALATIIGVQALLSFWPGRMRAGRRLAAAMAAFPAVGAAVALAFGWFTGYWS